MVVKLEKADFIDYPIKEGTELDMEGALEKTKKEVEE